MKSQIFLATAILCLQLASLKSAAAQSEVEAAGNSNMALALPPRNTLPLTPASWCAGLLNALKITKQSFTDEAAVLCTNGAPTPRFTEILNGAYTGVGDPTIVTINRGMLGNDVQLFVAFAMKLPKPAVQTLLGEEKHVPSMYDQGNLKIQPKFVNPPPINNGDADTAFNVEQYTEVNDVISFKETSKYELKMYRLHPNNFDFFMAARTLVTPTTQFRKAVVLRAIMADPSDPKKSIAVSVLNFVMNDRNGNGDNVRQTFERFVEADILALYKNQTSN